MKVLIELLNKKKTMVMIATWILGMATHLGFEVDLETVMKLIVTPGVALIGAIAAEDFGKAGKKIENGKE